MARASAVRIFAHIMSEADALERGMCLGLGLAPGERDFAWRDVEAHMV